MTKNVKATLGGSSLLIVSLAALIVALSLPMAKAQDRVPLFRLGPTQSGLAESEGSLLGPSSIGSVEETEVHFNFKSLTQFSDTDETHLRQLSFPLPDGVLRVATQRARGGLEERGETDFTWRGRLKEGGLLGDVVLTFTDGAVSGLIYAGETVYEVATKGGRHFLVKLDQSKFPECFGDLRSTEEETAPAEAATKEVGALRDTGNAIDVLVLYTSSVRASLGGDTQARNFAQQAIDSANTAYLNSRITQRVRLVGARLSPVSETGSLDTELTNLRSNATVASLRNQFRADLVAMISNSGGFCGIGNLMGSVNGNPNNAFTVTSRTCAVGNLSFAHELGHNMGSAHNPENGRGGTFSYSFGHWVNGSFRTVMSYSNPCASGCTRRPYFSNPSVRFNGSSTGIANSRDNARSINNTDVVIANYRMGNN